MTALAALKVLFTLTGIVFGTPAAFGKTCTINTHFSEAVPTILQDTYKFIEAKITLISSEIVNLMDKADRGP
jgi:hypothetical protein